MPSSTLPHELLAFGEGAARREFVPLPPSWSSASCSAPPRLRVKPHPPSPRPFRNPLTLRQALVGQASACQSERSSDPPLSPPHHGANSSFSLPPGPPRLAPRLRVSASNHILLRHAPLRNPLTLRQALVGQASACQSERSSDPPLSPPHHGANSSFSLPPGPPRLAPRLRVSASNHILLRHARPPVRPFCAKLIGNLHV